jgi:hypothetical protein
MLVEQPRLTIGIPTYNRPHRLAMAIASALAQQRPAAVLVADQTGLAADVVKPYLGTNPYVRYLRTDASCLWENWTAAAEACDTEFFCWLQDDDLVSPQLSRRVVWSFDEFPKANLYLARLGISGHDMLANWWQGTGPMVPMNLLYGFPTIVSGILVTAGSYFSSWALSPGMAFRHSSEAIAAIRRCPKDCDLYNERIVLAELGRDADVICDPATMGYWVQHEGNESKRQVRHGGRVGQFPRLVERIDAALADRPDWHQALESWCLLVGVGVLEHWLEEAKEYDVASETYAQAKAIVAKVLRLHRPIAPETAPPKAEPQTAVDPKPRKARKAVTR